ncbi:MAG: alpha/beta hydrolase [Psychroserpens sp.]|nr:alpha/beta hydrolase [Psychroserpens sp.]RZN83418.1 MAG: alpha/beta hydrolase [Winogradskyella sp.]MBO6630459.1 alpha/beta hydrolase [Psychroserpens sp.]MBO6652806.1 alpha/beta hydrolase [Psychroserpens sp.]MBO6681422.1 alpha/beta hydrolase [Psychroserpens sp.]
MTYKAFRKSQKSFLSKDGEIKFIEEGSGPALLLLHGIPTSGWLYRKMITPLVNEGYRVIVPDMLGFGGSDSPKGYEIYSEPIQAQRLLALMDSLKLKNWIHVFHDAGGLWTWELLKKQPNRINRLVILNTIIYKDGFKPPIRFGRNFITKGIMTLYKTKLINDFLIKKLFEGGLSKVVLSKSELEGYRLPLLEGKINGMYYFFSKTCHNIENYKSLLQSLNIPASVIWGKNDVFLLWKLQAEKVVEDLKITKDNIHLLDAKHFIQEEIPKEICNLIINYNSMKIAK